MPWKRTAQETGSEIITVPTPEDGNWTDSFRDKVVKKYLIKNFTDIDMMVNPGSMQLSTERKALIMEQTLIGLYQPESNKI